MIDVSLEQLQTLKKALRDARLFCKYEIAFFDKIPTEDYSAQKQELYERSDSYELLHDLIDSQIL